MSQTCDENGIFIVKRAGMEGIMELIEIRKKLKKELDKGRYEHTKGVMYTAGCLAMAHEYSMEKAMLAGLLHDCAKCIPNDQKIEMCEQNHILINPVEYKSPYLLHAKLGAFLAETVYEVSDPQILHAIKVHTTGEPDMSLLDKIIYIADYIEPMRYKASRLPEIRKLAFEDLDECMYEILKDTLEYLEEDSAEDIEPTSREAYIYYKELHNKRGNVTNS